MAERVATAEAAAGGEAAAMCSAAADLFRAWWTAWVALDRERFFAFAAEPLAKDWCAYLDDHKRDEVRVRGEIKSGPEADLVGIVQYPDEPRIARVRVRAKIRAHVEHADGKTTPLPEARGRKTWNYDMFWSVYWDGERWRAWSTRDQTFTDEYLGEPLAAG